MRAAALVAAIALELLAVEGARSLEALLDRPAAWFAGDEAARIAENVVLHQRPSGGWPKNVDTTRPPAVPAANASGGSAPAKSPQVPDAQSDATFDNGATTTQLRFLARRVSARSSDRFQAAFVRGLDYLFAAQYPNGGWPQVFPLLTDYSRHITFNDGAMTNVLALLEEVAAGKAPYAFVDESRRRRAAEAVRKGVRVILDAQIRVAGVKTAWCAQHDELTLEPRPGRRYEHPSISGKESVDVVRFLMSLEAPSGEVVEAVEAAVAWLKAVAANGPAGPQWARFYEIGTNRPIYSGRDGVIRYDIAEIEEERRTGYSWSGPYARELLSREYPAWKARPRTAASADRDRLIVAQDGSGDFRTIQEALDAIPEGNTAHRLVLIRNGVYREKLFLTKSLVSLVGEDRHLTRVEYAVLRREWRASHPDDWGAAVVNIGPEATGIVLANLTVRNDHGSRDGDHDHQFAIRSTGRATRIALLHADVLSDGGDTLSLWNTESGLSYASDCSFDGWVDMVCPRGWAYITNSRFFGHSTSATIWHDGSGHEDQKLVIRNSRFDGDPGVALGRHHRDAHFYLLDCELSARIADLPITAARAAPGGTPTPRPAGAWTPSTAPPGAIRLGTRAYYSGCRRDGPPFAWLADNLHTATGAPRDEDITAAWTFGGRWDPEASLPAVLPFAALPRPESGWRYVDPAGATLRFTPGRDARTHRIHFGVTDPLPLRVEQTAARFDTGPLLPGTTYRWRVDSVTPAGVVPGPVWSFTTRRPTPPAPASPQAGAAAARSPR